MAEPTPIFSLPDDLQAREHQRVAREKLEAFLLTRLETDETVEVNEEDFRRMREEFLRRRKACGGT